MAGEVELALILCAGLLGGEAEVRVPYAIDAGEHHVRIDCLTDTDAIEVGLDNKRSSLDSVQQALFAADLTGRRPVVVLIDTDGQEDAMQYRIERAARRSDVRFIVCARDFLLRWRMTEPFRARRETLRLASAGGRPLPPAGGQTCVLANDPAG